MYFNQFWSTTDLIISVELDKFYHHPVLTSVGMHNVTLSLAGFLLGIFQGGKSIVMQISFVMLLFPDQISGRGKSFQGGAPWPPVEESQFSRVHF